MTCSRFFQCCALALCCGLLFSACAPPPPQNALFYQYFDTLTELSASGMSRKDFEAFRKSAEETLGYYHRLFDKYHTYDGMNNLKTVNDEGHIRPVAVDAPLFALLEQSAAYCKETGGKVDISQGALLDCWQLARDTAQLPDPQTLKEAQAASGIESVVLDKKEHTVFLSKEGVSLDLGAVAKGYAIQKTAEALEAAGYSSFILNGGGNVKAVGRSPKKDGLWSLGLQSPEKESQALLLTLRTPPTSMVTSGSYRRTVQIDGKDYGHIIDPQSGCPARLWQSVTIVCQDSAAADMLSTALFLLDKPAGEALLQRYGASAIWIAMDGTLTASAELISQITVH